MDPFTGATSSFDAPPEKGTNYNSGDWGVSDQNGAATYAVPIDVPPGRNGMAPSLSLRYSSNLPLRGGLAAGWTFDLPSIEVDLTLGAAEGVQYKIDLGGVSGRLIEVPDASPYPQSTAYRVQFDNSNTRIFFIDASQPGQRTAGWIALTPDGVRHHFEGVAGAHGKGVWNITRQVDSFGNTVRYEWSALFKNNRSLGQSLLAIQYSGNAKANLVPHARIGFDYAPLEFCHGSEIPIGAAYRRGNTQVTGAQSLNAIKVFVRNTQTSGWSLRKQVDLNYRQQNSVLYERAAVVASRRDDGATAPPLRPSASDLTTQAPGNVGVGPSTIFLDDGASAATFPSAGDQITEAPENLGATTSNETPGHAVSCGQNPLRYLTQIDVKAFDINGSATVLPPIRFDYNGRRDLTQPQSQIPGENPMREVTVNVPGFGQEGISAPHLGGLRTTLLDIDNDGVRDRVSVIEENRVCTLVWNRGLRSGSFEELERKSPLPTAAWYDEWRGNPGSVLDGKEGCTLSGQVAYRSAPKVFNDPTGPTQTTVLAPGNLSYQFMDYTGDGRLDLITNVWASSTCFWTYDPWAIPIANDPICSFGLDLDTGGGSAPPLQAEEDRGRFLWRVYPGTGNPDQPFLNQALLNADVPQMPIRVRSPVQLPLPAGEDALDLSTFTHYSVPTLFDIDGDGFLDAIDTKSTTLAPCTNELLLRKGCDWTVYLGDGTGSFPETDDAHIWDVPKATLASDNWEKESCDADFFLRRATVIGLRDIEGDGLADLVVQLSDGKLYSYRNTGSSFDSQAQSLNGDTALEQIQTDCDGFVLAGSLRNGDRGYQRRLVDLDADGLLDMVWFEGGPSITATNSVKAKFNLGGRFGDPVTLLFPEKWALGKRLFAAKWVSDEFAGNWHIVNDLTDVTGDGLADLVQWHAARPEVLAVAAGGRSVSAASSPRMSYVSSPGLPPAPDLLRRVTNGRGMVLSFSYAPSTDRDVVDWTGSDSTLPTPRWVVSKSTVAGGFGTPATTTRYQYKQPNYRSAAVHSGFKERSQFAGFSQHIQTTNYANGTSQQVRKLYDYKGLHADLASVRTFRDGQLHRVKRKEWEHKTLFAGSIHVALPTLTKSCITNAPNMSEVDCFAQKDHVRRVKQAWSHNSISQQFQNNHSVEGKGSNGSNAQADDHRTSYQYDLRYGTVTGHDPEDYRVRVRETTEAISGALNNFDALVGRSVTEFNNQTGLPDNSYKFFDTSIFAKTNFVYDALTGNLLKIQKPVQSLSNGGTDTFSALSYDSHQLFVLKASNELGHQTRTTHDTATGVLIKREGPNKVFGPSPTIFDAEQWQIDGLGRVLSHSISIDTQVNGSANYAEHTVERFSYNDMNFQNTGQPVSHSVKQLRDIGGTHWIETEQDLDGNGRVLENRQLFNGEMATHTIYSYSDSGGIDSIETPDPRDPDNRITYTYDYDGLGRVTLLRRPDDTSITVSYEGLSQTISEVTPDNTGSSKTKRSDVFGHLVEIQEHNSGSPSAVTRYQFDVVDNLEKITDAEGNITTMNHDWQGNRIGINRGQRTWQYRYDLNSNLTSRRSPMPVSSDPTPYTTAYKYDDLDRLLSKSSVDIRVSTVPSPTPNTPPATGAINTILYQYDAGHNGVGRLSQVDLPFGVVAYNYDARGLIAREERTFTLDQIANMSASQVVERSYNALGKLTESDWQGDRKWRIRYDERGLVDSIDWFDPTASTDIAWKSAANYERELTGLPSARNTDYGQTRRFTYDALARPLTDSVKLDGSTATVAERRYKYTAAGNLENVTGHTNGVTANAKYTYDLQHRLLMAVTPSGYRGNFTYSPTGNVLTADVESNNAAQTRNVSYSYGQVDPQAVDKLQNNNTDVSYAEFAYDDAGNMTWRSAPDGDTLLHWNGQDQIRRFDTPDGSETYYYDHTGQRMLVVNPNQGVRFWFGEREIHYNLGGTETLNYLHLSAGGPTLARIESTTTNITKIELQYADALQNLMFSLDKDSNVTASFLYGPFGEVLSETGSDEHRRQFNGKENDAATGLRYYGYRYYDPLILRWNSADPLYTVVPELGKNQPQRMNLYAFSLNNPVRYYDPDGRDAKKDGDSGDEGPNSDNCSDFSSESQDSCDETDQLPEEDVKTVDETLDQFEQTYSQVLAACNTSKCVLDIEAKLLNLEGACKGNQRCLESFDRLDRVASLTKKEIEFHEMGPERGTQIGVAPPLSQRLSKSPAQISIEQGNTLRGGFAGSVTYYASNPTSDPTKHEKAQARANIANSVMSLAGKDYKQRNKPAQQPSWKSLRTYGDAPPAAYNN